MKAASIQALSKRDSPMATKKKPGTATPTGAAPALRWRSAVPPKNAPDLLGVNLTVDVVLNVTPWVGKLARIYMVMPTVPQSSLMLQWATRGTLLAGQISGGQRQLVFQGVIPGSRIEDTMLVTATTDARDPSTPSRVNFTFEIEVPSR